MICTGGEDRLLCVWENRSYRLMARSVIPTGRAELEMDRKLVGGWVSHSTIEATIAFAAAAAASSSS